MKNLVICFICSVIVFNAPVFCEGVQEKQSNLELQEHEEFAIPLKIDQQEIITKLTRCEVLAVEGNELLLAFSADRPDCRIEIALGGIDSAVSLIWAPGAVHIFTNKSIKAGLEEQTTSNTTRISEEGRIIMVIESGLIYEENRIAEWTFISDNLENPLMFKIVPEKGYLHIGGSGTVKNKNGQEFSLKDHN
jgi:hypothetical protein